MYVVDHLEEPLLGRPAIENLNILKWIYEIEENDKFDPRKKYLNLFSGLGLMNITYQIKLQPGAQPYSLSCPRRVALPLRPKLKEELEKWLR